MIDTSTIGSIFSSSPQSLVCGEWAGPIPAVLGQKAGYTVDSSLVYRRATTKRSFTLTFTPVGNLESPVKLTLNYLANVR